MSTHTDTEVERTVFVFVIIAMNSNIFMILMILAGNSMTFMILVILVRNSII